MLFYHLLTEDSVFWCAETGIRVWLRSFLQGRYMRRASDIVIRLLAKEIIPGDLAVNEDFLQIALIELPPSRRAPKSAHTPSMLDRLADTRGWSVRTPVAALISNGKVASSWEQEFRISMQSCGIWKASRKFLEIFRFYKQQISHHVRYIWKGGGLL